MDSWTVTLTEPYVDNAGGAHLAGATIDLPADEANDLMTLNRCFRAGSVA